MQSDSPKMVRIYTYEERMRRKCGLHLVNAMPEGQQFVETIA